MKFIRKAANHLRKSVVCIGVFSLLLLNCVNLSGQIDPINVYQTLPSDLNVCADSTTIEVYAVVQNDNADSVTIELRFPPGTFYVPGSNAVIQTTSLTFDDLGNQMRVVFFDLWEDTGGPFYLFEGQIFYCISKSWTASCNYKVEGAEVAGVRQHLSYSDYES